LHANLVLPKSILPYEKFGRTFSVVGSRKGSVPNVVVVNAYSGRFAVRANVFIIIKMLCKKYLPRSDMELRRWERVKV
jgi:hypothetical protein